MGCSHRGRWDRRTFLGVLGVGLAAAVTGCAPLTPQSPSAQQPPTMTPDSPTGDSPPPSTSESEPPSPPTTPPADPDVLPNGADGGGKGVLRHGPAGTRQIALTVDDGYCDDCVAGYVDFAERTGIHLTFSPNGVYDRAWAPHAAVLRPLIEAGQVQIMNHTYSHPRLTRLRASRVQRELDRNEQWITKTFGTSSRPYYRPPFGVHNATVDGLAAGLGFDRVVLWNGSFSDSTVITPEFLMSQARKYLQPGVIMLGHANHPTVLGLFDQITQLIQDRTLTPVTLNEMFGTTSGQPTSSSTPPDDVIPI